MDIRIRFTRGSLTRLDCLFAIELNANLMFPYLLLLANTIEQKAD